MAILSYQTPKKEEGRGRATSARHGWSCGPRGSRLRARGAHGRHTLGSQARSTSTCSIRRGPSSLGRESSPSHPNSPRNCRHAPIPSYFHIPSHRPSTKPPTEILHYQKEKMKKKSALQDISNTYRPHTRRFTMDLHDGGDKSQWADATSRRPTLYMPLLKNMRLPWGHEVLCRQRRHEEEEERERSLERRPRASAFTSRPLG